MYQDRCDNSWSKRVTEQTSSEEEEIFTMQPRTTKSQVDRCKHDTAQLRQKMPGGRDFLKAPGVFMILLLFFDITRLFPSVVVAVPSKRNNRHRLSSTLSSNSPANSTEYLQIVETEVWDASSNSWAPGGGRGSTLKGTDARWTDEQGQESLPPTDVKPPKGYVFVSEWKIVVETGRDSLGWEYQFRYLQPPKRRRIWLRSLGRKQKGQRLSPIEDSRQKGRDIMTQLHQEQKRQLDNLAEIVQRVRDDFNFKGFGLSLYKSFLFLESFGVTLFVPLTMNFDFWDRHPGLPSLGTVFALYYPPTIAQFLSLSMNLQWLKFAFTRTLYAMRQLVVFVLYEVLVRGLFLCVSLWLYPFVGRFVTLPSLLPKSPVLARPVFNENFSERVGCSLSYRWSLKRGFEWRVSTWHSYLPTLTVYQNIFEYLLPTWIHQKLRMSSAKIASTSNSGSGVTRSGGAAAATEKAIGWWQAHFARLGVSTAMPMPDPPHISCSAQLNLSGLYFRNLKSNQQKSDDSRAVEDDKSRMRPAISTTQSQLLELEGSEEALLASTSSEESSLTQPIS